jgi:flagellum-specific ATP synthase
MNDIVGEEHRQAADSLKRLMSAYQQSEDLISIGAYQAGSNPTVDLAIQLRERINAFLQQDVTERVTFTEVVNDLMNLNQLREGLAGQSPNAVKSTQNNTEEVG